MSPKIRQRNVCTHHPERRAQGSCAVCAARLCRECALVVRGVYYCFSPSCRPEELRLPLNKPGDQSSAEAAPDDPFLRTLVFRSSVTIALCAAVFAVWAVREAWKLHAENATLRASRLALIEQLKSSNRRIGEIATSDTIDSGIGNTAIPPPVPAVSAPARSIAAMPVAPRAADPAAGNSFCHFVNGPTGLKTVAFTFDGGSLANAAGAILDTLASRSVTATMFLTGEFIRRFPDITRRIVTAGHECGNHTYSHPHLTRYGIDRTAATLPSVNKAALHEELFRAQHIFHETTGRQFLPLWRVPYGEFNDEICRWAFEAGYLHVGWRQGRTWREGLDSNDWISDPQTDGYHTPAEFLDKVIALARLQPYGINGGILLFHLGSERKKSETQIHSVLGTLIDTLRHERYRIVPVSEMIASAGVDLASLREKITIQ